MNKKYEKLLDEGWETGTANTFADLGLPDAERLQAKAYLRSAILARIAELRVSQVEAARLIGIPQPKLSSLMTGDTARGFSSDKLIEFATKLGLNVEIKVLASDSPRGRLVVADAGSHKAKRKQRAKTNHREATIA